MKRALQVLSAPFSCRLSLSHGLCSCKSREEDVAKTSTHSCTSSCSSGDGRRPLSAVVATEGMRTHYEFSTSLISCSCRCCRSTIFRRLSFRLFSLSFSLPSHLGNHGVTLPSRLCYCSRRLFLDFIIAQQRLHGSRRADQESKGRSRVRVCV